MIQPLAVVRAVLDQSMAVPVSTKVPSPRPSQFIRIVRVGGARDRSVDHALIVVECWAPNSVTAEQDALAVDEILRMSPNGGPFAGGWISRWDCNSIADNPDPETPQARFTVAGVAHILTTT
ncbi:hypothetical protein [Gordonia malaquae]|uniref:hypothetical protein n=1 Tax=Gordonia malaquae TaxID=410332 RepID=UPI0030FE5BD2